MDVPQGSSIISPQTFPYIVSAFLSLVGFVLILEVLRGRYGTPEGTKPGDNFQPADLKTMALVAAA
ncbi:MAG: hypothetical protein RIQ73_235, partial [Actinomycetota bacterium]